MKTSGRRKQRILSYTREPLFNSVASFLLLTIIYEPRKRWEESVEGGRKKRRRSAREEARGHVSKNRRSSRAACAQLTDGSTLLHASHPHHERERERESLHQGKARTRASERTLRAPFFRRTRHLAAFLFFLSFFLSVVLSVLLFTFFPSIFELPPCSFFLAARPATSALTARERSVKGVHSSRAVRSTHRQVRSFMKSGVHYSTSPRLRVHSCRRGAPSSAQGAGTTVLPESGVRRTEKGAASRDTSTLPHYVGSVTIS